MSPNASGVYVAAILGSSDYFPDDDVYAAIERLALRHAKEGLLVVTSDAPGVAKVVADNARLLNVRYDVVSPGDDESAAAVRSALNAAIVERADVLIAFFHPGPSSDLALNSSGTTNAVKQAQGRRIGIHVHHEGKWWPGMPVAPAQPPDGWRIPAGYVADVRTGTCGSRNREGCGAEVLWADTGKGKRAPLNRDGSNHLSTCHVARRARQ